jgi:Domain of unknown function (DUF5134)
MAGPSWLAGLAAAAVIAIAIYCAARLAASWLRRRETESDADAIHVLMGTAMAGMFVPRLGTLPAPAWEAAFAIASVWFAWQAIRARRGRARSPWQCPYPVPHLVECAAMLYMFLALRGTRPAGPGTAMPGMAAGPAGAAGTFPALAVLLALFMVGYVLWTTDQLTSPARATAAAAPGGAARYPMTHPGPSSGLSAARTQDAPAGPGAASAPRGRPGDPPGPPMLAPRLAACSRIAMSIAMGYMLVLML